MFSLFKSPSAQRIRPVRADYTPEEVTAARAARDVYSKRADYSGFGGTTTTWHGREAIEAKRDGRAEVLLSRFGDWDDDWWPTTPDEASRLLSEFPPLSADPMDRHTVDIWAFRVPPEPEPAPRPTVYFVTRHPGAVEWARRRGIEAVAVEHFDLDTTQIHEGDVVMGTLPINLVAAVNAAGGVYLHLEMTVPREARGTELSADDMERFGARLVEYEVTSFGAADRATRLLAFAAAVRAVDGPVSLIQHAEAGTAPGGSGLSAKAALTAIARGGIPAASRVLKEVVDEVTDVSFDDTYESRRDCAHAKAWAAWVSVTGGAHPDRAIRGGQRAQEFFTRWF